MKKLLCIIFIYSNLIMICISCDKINKEKDSSINPVTSTKYYDVGATFVVRNIKNGLPIFGATVYLEVGTDLGLGRSLQTNSSGISTITYTYNTNSIYGHVWVSHPSYQNFDSYISSITSIDQNNEYPTYSIDLKPK